MGAVWFETIGVAKDPKIAFNNLVDDALFEDGHNGYTGTIAEKRGSGFRMLTYNPAEFRAKIEARITTLRNIRDRLREKNTTIDQAISLVNALPYASYFGKRTKTDIRAYLVELIKEQMNLKKQIKSKPDPYELGSIVHDVLGNDKYGPAWCIDLDPRIAGVRKPKRFLFCGFARH